MTAYHKINGVHCSEDPRLIRDIPRSEWKYDGLVLCDWWGIYSTSELINAGMDLEMPGPTDWRCKILAWATRSRKVSIETIDSSVRRVLKLVNRVLAAQSEPVKDSDTEKNRALLRETTAVPVVLLKKNEANVLPLVKDSKTRYALIGDHWKNPAVAGDDSSEVTPYYVSTPYSAFVEAVGEDSFICAMGCYCKKSNASGRARP
jgi:beta-glucosidase